MHTYDTVSEAVNDLRKRGYSVDFNLQADSVTCTAPELVLRPSEFEITEVYRFEGNTDPDDEAIVYAIASKQGQKGVLVNGYGASADSLNDDMIRKLQIHH
ncbi:MAG: hypothetical protein QM731_10130 [Chitinophagaceae bacterium]